MNIKKTNQKTFPARVFRHGNNTIVSRNVTERYDEDNGLSYDYEAYVMPAAPISDPDQYCLDNYAAVRKAVLLAHWPQDSQNEAVTENAMGRPEKMDELKAFITCLKIEFPKPS